MDLCILLNNAAKCKIAKSITHFFQDNSSCDVLIHLKWDAVKAVFSGSIVSNSPFYKKQKERAHQSLIQSISNLETKHKQTWSNKVYRKPIAIRKALELLESTQILQKMFSVKQKCWRQSPKALRYILWKLKQKHSSTYISAIPNSEGITVDRTSQIVSAFVNYYKKLYSSGNPNITSK